MSLPQARITNPTPRERLSIGAWSAKSGIERLKISSAWVAFLTSSAGVVIAPAILFLNGKIGLGIATALFGVIAIVLLFGLWRSKAPLWRKLGMSVFLCVPILGVVFYHILDAPERHDKGDSSGFSAGHPGFHL